MNNKSYDRSSAGSAKPTRETAALAIINATREKHGLEKITWDFLALSSTHREDALRLADAVLAIIPDKPQEALDAAGAHRLAGLIVDYTDNNLSMFDACDMPSDKAKELHEQAKALRDRLALSLSRQK